MAATTLLRATPLLSGEGARKAIVARGHVGGHRERPGSDRRPDSKPLPWQVSAPARPHCCRVCCGR